MSSLDVLPKNCPMCDMVIMKCNGNKKLTIIAVILKVHAPELKQQTSSKVKVSLKFISCELPLSKQPLLNIRQSLHPGVPVKLVQ